MIILGLKDPNQSCLTANSVTFEEGILTITNNEKAFKKHFRLSNGYFTCGNYWVDAQNRVVMVELFNSAGVSSFCIPLYEDFELLFPEACNFWESYYFRLHYSK